MHTRWQGRAVGTTSRAARPGLGLRSRERRAETGLYRSMSDSGFMDMYQGGRKLLDAVGIGEVVAIAKGAKDMVPGAGLTPGADKVLGPLGMVTSGIDLFSGGWNLAKGFSNDDGVAITDGVHDTVGGTAGLLGNVPGPVGAAAKAFSAGFAVGDMIAPMVFGSEEEDNKAHTEAIPEDGVFKPSTGNDYVDGALDLFGVRD